MTVIEKLRRAKPGQSFKKTKATISSKFYEHVKESRLERRERTLVVQSVTLIA